MFKNGTLWNDIDGNPIHAHGGWMLSYGGYFYWYGEDRRENYYVSCYRSKDLRNWEFRNHILTTESKMEPYRANETAAYKRDWRKSKSGAAEGALQQKDGEICIMGTF